MAELQVRRLGYALGAEVAGVDLTRPLDEETVAGIRQAWLDHLLLCFPGQHLDGEQMVHFAGRFGTVDDNKFSKQRDPENSRVILLTNRDVPGRPFSGYKNGQSWHSDRSYLETPTTGTFIVCKEIPEVGGDTMFTNMYLAYETLSAGMRAIVDALSAVHDTAKIKNIEQRGAKELADIIRERPPTVHEMVKVHPETKRRALYVGERVRNILGMTEEESRPLLDYLTQHAVRYEFTYRHRWTAGDVIMWDNRCTMHIALSDYDLRGQPRHLIRASLGGPKTGERYTGNETIAAAKELAPAT